ncbi:MAG: DUF4258 domain-containing protein [Maribacter dokdonensis]|uniref:DUF4258 domain-containing protein n=1 Tax=Maribacter dokdonensis TaxID=320912 RepID=A0ABY0UE54_9FLAO|nr:MULTISPECIES: DUF4258 domain-containing protein [Maribacter]APA65821.1 hypothetical protein YQ22_16800 [Maribacter sp. 1_2014MBL_MicDiv]MBU2901902.1 DUF4258 domain-containing protein [Maribacter dokdonensis]MDP2527420.1 DUF4258 domain-containing protein [Maribacter dokdonensis]PHN92093.1 hypothetical protein CSC80_14010 [Maribacter sp. 6B07]SDS52697.1 hypothetical protein SAMN05192545_1557 [Maribacter dokdonensis]|tara:strand:+ start:2834 stop:3217 length:384 start_codon:yes stop_codon:yes gene_type:complete
MDFLKRLGYFLVGMSIGIVFLTFFLKKKSEETGVYFCYLPNCRTLKDIRSKSMYYSEEAQQKLQELQLDSTAVTYILTEGDVDFGNSDTKSVPCKTYVIESDYKEQDYIFTVKNCREKATIENVQLQ